MRREVFKGCWRVPNSAREQLLLEKFSRQPGLGSAQQPGGSQGEEAERSQGWVYWGGTSLLGGRGRSENSGPWLVQPPRWWEEDEGRSGRRETP